MSENLRYFEAPGRCIAVALPFELEQFLRDWSRVQAGMVRQVPPIFTRDEWAYLAAFLDAGNLLSVFEKSFGKQLGAPPPVLSALLRPRGPVAVWLPNNVSLLGPLTLVMMSLTGNPLRLKGGSQAEDLAGAFLEFARRNAPTGPLQAYLNEQVRHAIFERDDPQHREMAGEAQVRIVFGSDEAAAAIHNLPHPLESVGFAFVDRRSEAWIEQDAATDNALADLLKVFAVYGQAGCTSPRRVVLLGGAAQSAVALRDRLADLWPRLVKRQPAMHVASANVMARQWAAATGWDAILTPGHGAVLAAGGLGLPEFQALMGLMVVAGTAEEARASLPPNIQTLGYALKNPGEPRWLELLARSKVKRMVPIGRMHHFGPVWDGQPFWRQAFEEVEMK